MRHSPAAFVELQPLDKTDVATLGAATNDLPEQRRSYAWPRCGTQCEEGDGRRGRLHYVGTKGRDTQ